MRTRRKGRSGRLPGQATARKARATLLEALEPRVLLATFVVNSSRDVALTALDPGEVTFRAALQAAVTNEPVGEIPGGDPGLDVIEFAIDDPSPIVLSLKLGPLPAIIDQVIIDGFALPDGSRGEEIIEVIGSPSLPYGLLVQSAGNTISGLAIRGFETGILILGSAASGNLIAGNEIGADPAPPPVGGNGLAGILIEDAPSNTVGGPTQGDRNLISGNLGDGVLIRGTGASANVIAGNFIGTDASGLAAVPNLGSGVALREGASGNLIGGPATSSRNVISGNGSGNGRLASAGVLIEGAPDNLVLGNLIGLGADGQTPLGNLGSGIAIRDASGTTVGGTMSDDVNVISANEGSGIEVDDSSSFDNGVLSSTGLLVRGNRIGTDATGTAPRGNLASGIRFIGAVSGATIGGDVNGAGNLLSGNFGHGLFLDGRYDDDFESTLVTEGALIQGNIVGLDVTGTVRLANTLDGVHLRWSRGVTVGGSTAPARNLLSGNLRNGLMLVGETFIGGTGAGNLILGNFVGLDLGGEAALGNAGDGIALEDAPDNVIGGTAGGDRNVIAGNSGRGILVVRSGSTGNAILGNLIGSGAPRIGGPAIPNLLAGIRFEDGASDNTVGGPDPGAGNLIAGNLGNGVELAEGEGSEGPGLPPVRVSLLGNTFRANGGIPIDLGADGVTFNDTGDPDLGPNRFQNYPIFFETGLGGDILGIAIEAEPLTSYLVQVYAGTPYQSGGVPVVDAEELIETVTLTTDADGFASVVQFSPGAAGRSVTGTATDPLGNTSEFTPLLDPLFVVTNTNDEGDGSLRQAILDANRFPGIQTITFAIPGEGPHSIVLSSELPEVTEAVVIDAYTQDGALRNTLTAGSDAVLQIVVTAGGPEFSGLRLTSGGSTISGLAFNGFGLEGIAILGPLATSNVVSGNFVGTDSAGLVGLGNGRHGVLIADGASGNTIGGTAPGDRNIISGNGSMGIFLGDFGTSNNHILGNLIGLDATGGAGLGNGISGVGAFAGPSDNTIGGPEPGAGNVLSGNGQEGIFIGGEGSSGFLIRGNLIGLDASGSFAVPNRFAGVAINFGPTANTVGGAALGEGNVISGNGREGVFIGGFGTSANVVLGNRIGLDAPGTGAVPNLLSGVGVGLGASGNTIGALSEGEFAEAANTISGNARQGVVISGPGTTGNAILGNSIFGNLGLGIELDPGGGDSGGPITAEFGTLQAGPNNLQPAPVLESVAIVPVGGLGPRIRVAGFLDAAPGFDYRIEFFVTPSEPSGLPEGREYVGFASVTTGEGGRATFSETVRFPGPFVGTIVTATATDPFGDTSEFSFGIELPTDLAITKEAPAEILIGDPLTFTLTASNLGFIAASGVVVTDFLPEGFELTGIASTKGTATRDGRAVIIDVGLLLPEESVTVTLVGIAGVVGELVNVAEVTARTPDDDPDNDTATTVTLVVDHSVDPGADLAIFKEAPADVLLDDPLTFTLTVANFGPGLASGVVATDTLPEGFELTGIASTKGTASRDGRAVRVEIGELRPEEVVTVTLVGIAVSPGVLFNTAEVTSTTFDPDPANNTARTSTEVIAELVVTNTDDSGRGSLRQAIRTANRLPGFDTITFLIPGDQPTIRPLSPLPTITDPVAIDGFSQPTGRVELDGSRTRGNGLVVASPGSLIAGLTINRFAGSGVVLLGVGGNQIVENHIGTDVLGLTGLGNLQNGILAIGAADNRIAGNVISGNFGSGVELFGPGTTGNLVVGNLIGTDASGLNRLGNHHAGVLVTAGAAFNRIGGVMPGEGNVLSANRTAGVLVFDPRPERFVPDDGQLAPPTGNTLIVGNEIGVAKGGLGVLQNGLAGVLIAESSFNTVGGIPGASNLIAGGVSDGVLIVGEGASGNFVQGNAIGNAPGPGMTFEGTGSGVKIEYGARDNTVGGPEPGAGNTIAANAAAGVWIGNGSTNNAVVANAIGDVRAVPSNGVGILIQTGAAENLVIGNRVGGNVHGMIVNPGSANNRIFGNVFGASEADGTIGNVAVGLTIRESGGNSVGGPGASGNLISGNGIGPGSGVGVLIEGPSAARNLIFGNTIGLDRDGERPVPNASVGLLIDGGRDNRVGGLLPDLQNLISGNGTVGVQILGPLASGNVVQGNQIGTRLGGPSSAPNGLVGVYIENAPGNTVGGAVDGARNVISGNGVVDVQLTGPGASGNLVAGNLIGTGPLGAGSLQGASTGIFLEGAPGNTIGGLAAVAGNLVSGHSAAGIHVFGPGASGNRILGNRIGTDLTGTQAVRNEHGITLDDAPGNTVGGVEPGAGNLLSGNFLGLVISGAGASGNLVQGNRIGTDADGQARLPNLGGGLFVNAAPANTIGGLDPGAANVIAGNAGVGLQLFNVGASGNVIAGNRIGVDLGATRPIPNAEGGLFINDAPGNLVGGLAPGAGNLISGNVGTGLVVFGSEAVNNSVVGNVIGTPRAGDPAAVFGNDVGLFVTGVGGVDPIGPNPAQANTIRGNRITNVLVVGDLDGPLVTGVPEAIRDASGAIVALRLSFSQALAVGRAQARGNYRLNQGENGAGPAIPIASASYEAADRTVTLALGRPLASDASFRLVVSARPPGGLASVRNIPLDGDANGTPGGNFVARFRDGQFLRAPGPAANRPAAVSAGAIDSIFGDGGGLRVARRG